MHTNPYQQELAHTPFMLGRHGESVRNAGEIAQGRGNEIVGLPPNGLTHRGQAQSESIYPALAAAGIAVHHVNSSRLLRARETAEVFVHTHPAPKPSLIETPIPHLEEVSQLGWEAVYTRDKVKVLRKAALDAEIANLRAVGMASELEGHVAWTATLGRGESPLGAALRGVNALERYGVRPRELVFSHAMVNRYMEAIATQVPSPERASLQEAVMDTSALGRIATLNSLNSVGVPAFQAIDDKRNQQANGGVTEFTVCQDTGLWMAGRRIEPPRPFDTAAFIEHQRGNDGMWMRLTPNVAADTQNNE